MENLVHKTVADIVTGNYKTASVFEKYGIDFCCKGKIELEKACLQIDVDPDLMVRELNQVIHSAQDTTPLHFDEMPLEELVDFIVTHHHKYVLDSMPKIQSYLEKLAQVHGKQHPELLKIGELFNSAVENLSMHMKKEEIILFPFIIKMEESMKEGVNPGLPPFNTVQNPIRAMVSEHETEGNRFAEIGRLSGNYEVPEDGCSTYRIAYSMLKEFQEDLHRHIHLENNILFPKAIKMENELMELMK